MNILFKYWGNCDNEPKFSLDWYRHASSHKHKGFTIRIGLLGRVSDLTFVDDVRQYARDMSTGLDYTLALFPVPRDVLRSKDGKGLKGI